MPGSSDRPNLSTLALAILGFVLISGPTRARDLTFKQDEPRKQEEKKPKDKEDSKEDVEKKKRKLAHDLHMAELGLQVVQLQNQIKLATAEASLRKAARTRAEAAVAYEHHVNGTAPLKIKEAKLGIDSSRFSTEHAKDELNELISMYKADEFAEMTKELVLKRGRRKLEVAERRLKIALTKLEHLEKVQLPNQRDVLKGKLEDADQAFEAARSEVRKAKLEVQIALAESKFKLSELKLDLVQTQKDGKGVER